MKQTAQIFSEGGTPAFKKKVNFKGKLLKHYKQLECKMFRILLKHVSDHLSVLFNWHDYTFMGNHRFSDDFSGNIEAVTWGCSVKNVFLEISQNLQENTPVGVSFSIQLQAQPATLLKKRLWHSCFHVNFAKFLRTPFLI